MATFAIVRSSLLLPCLNVEVQYSSLSFNTLLRTYKGRGRGACKGGDTGRARGTPRSQLRSLTMSKALAKSCNGHDELFMSL